MVRFKNRYLLVEFRWHDGRVDATLTDAVVLGAIRQAVAHDFGDVGAGAAAAGLAVKYWSATTSLAVVRCGRDAHRRVWASMTMLRDVKGRAVVARVLHNASTLRSSRAATRSRVEAAFARLVARGGMPGGASAAAAGTEAAKVAIDAMCE
jgi:ribonuclease P/MRP protein subunit POP5